MLSGDFQDKYEGNDKRWLLTLFLEISLRFTIFPCETTDGELQTEGFSDAHKKEILQTNSFCKQTLRVLPPGLSPPT